MYISDRLFSENNPEEILYSVLMDETEQALYSDFVEAMFSKKHKHQKDVDLDEADSYRGIGRATLVGGLGGIVGAGAANYGRIKGYEKAREADREGASEARVRDIATKEGAKYGGIAGAGVGGGLTALAAAGTLGIVAKKAYEAKKVKDNHKILKFLNKSAKKKNSSLKGKLGKAVAAGTLAAGIVGAAGYGLTGAAGGALGASKKTRTSLDYRHAVEDSARKGRYRD